MGRRKSTKSLLKDYAKHGGSIENYRPFLKSNGGGSRGTVSLVPDPIEHRMIHLLSDTESMMYYFLRCDENVVHIREQYLLDTDIINDVREQLGYRRVTSSVCYTTDFLVDYKNGDLHAYSVKYKSSMFDPDSVEYKGNQNAYAKLIERQNTERAYWESQNVGFSIVTRDDLMKYRIRIKNNAFIMRFYDELFITNTEQKLLYLIAHHYYHVDMDSEFINPKALAANATFDIDAVYEKAISMKGVLLDG